MEDYNKEHVLNALLSLDINTRTRILVDQRSYLISILAYRFMISEHKIANLTNIKRDKINYNKKLAIQFYNDKLYKQNVYVYAQMFPFDFSVIELISNTKRSKNITLNIEKKFYNKLKIAGSILGHTDIRVTIKFFLEKSLKLWDK